MDILPNSNALKIVALAFALYVVSLTTYRLFLHPLRKIPGPGLAALTWWYEIYYDVFLPGQYNFKLLELHKQYGPIMRINPEEIHIADPEFLGEIYNARKRNKPPEPSLDIESSVAGTAEWDLHKMRRQAMTSFFSPKAVRELEPLLVRKRDMLVKVVESITPGEVLNLSDMYFAYCWDLIHEYAFAFDSTVLREDLSEAAKLRANSTDLLLQVNFTRYFGWINSIAAMLPGGIGERVVPPGVIDLKRTAARVAENVREVVNDRKTTREDAENDTQHRSIFYTIRDDPALPRAEKEPLRLQREGNFLVVAASDSPARAIHITHFYLMFRPECMEKLREELRPLGPSPGMKELNELSYLDAVFLEGTRLMFGLARRIFRVAPEDAIIYGKFTVPPGTNVATSTLCVHSDPVIFPEPFTFKPERWLGTDAKELRNKYHMTFGSKSPRSCLGIHLAEAEMKFAIAAVSRFEMELYKTGLSDVEYRHDYQMAHGKLGSQGVRAVVKGKLW